MTCDFVAMKSVFGEFGGVLLVNAYLLHVVKFVGSDAFEFHKVVSMFSSKLFSFFEEFKSFLVLNLLIVSNLSLQESKIFVSCILFFLSYSSFSLFSLLLLIQDTHEHILFVFCLFS